MTKEEKLKFNIGVFALTLILIGYGWILGMMTSSAINIEETSKRLDRHRENLHKRFPPIFKRKDDVDYFDEEDDYFNYDEEIDIDDEWDS